MWKFAAKTGTGSSISQPPFWTLKEQSCKNGFIWRWKAIKLIAGASERQRSWRSISSFECCTRSGIAKPDVVTKVPGRA